MSYTLIAGGYRSAIARLSFDGDRLTLVSDSKTPQDPSWVEGFSPISAFATSEAEGLVMSLDVGDGVTVTSQVETHGNPAQVIVLADKSAVAVANYVGGSITLHPINVDGTLGPSKATPLPFPYAEKAPNPDRQDASHGHGIVEVAGVLRDESVMYVLGEMGHSVAAFNIPKEGTNENTPIWDSGYLPPSVPKEYTTFMDGAEIQLHPQHDVLYVSNRLELHAAEKNNLPPRAAESGDAVAIMRLSEDGRSVLGTEWVQTGCCCVRGMQVSRDGKYVAVAGQCNSTVEMYALSDDGIKWTKVASLQLDAITDFVWM
ncbi:hypothetical protein CcaverHIS002_0402170 [Cutaneotrichosporon cavernicola]|uniref:Isomerase YbhE n=1 Tax=Cutaneotrichosporon cavernicola TaxID=279322 RepID=A0AA48L3R5_9TREE|nr:uncharacterized protein CcaverHIS019_0402130 [Cutaneotrichosporon cavernicola]BEI83613.1 hypothetical protein CcaverHIS002_0402170 [Cutaneotrichosporon cavernicola]BEI91393.1 hypothetical protein CcaverHIS019_0402130 [Cutaneotrichosporon cavernicola]BEI99167.1 hypothetical protein CcaverHIS631_0402100 [Cutaneotrichosporon cavernicola]